MKNNNRNTTAYVTGLAGEFHAMELLLRKGHHQKSGLFQPQR